MARPRAGCPRWRRCFRMRSPTPTSWTMLAPGMLALGAFAPFVFASLANAQNAAGAPQDVRYGRDVRPILADRCFKCHGPDEGTREAKLRLDLADAAKLLRKHGAALVPHDVHASLVW